MLARWREWFAAVGEPPDPFRFQSDEDHDGFLSKPLNSDGPLHGNCIPYAARSTEVKHLYSRNVTTLHWPGIFTGAPGGKSTSGTISIDSGVDAARFLARFGRTAAEGGLLAPIQMNKNPPSGSRSASRANSYILLPRCDMDFKFHLPYAEAETYVSNDPDKCLLDEARMRSELHFSDSQIQHHAKVAGEAVAQLFGLEPTDVAVIVMRSKIPNMDLVRVRRDDDTGGQVEFAPRREKIGNDVRGNHVLCGQTVLIKPSYWLIFLHASTVTDPPSEVYDGEDATEVQLSALDFNVARLFRLDEVSKEPTPGSNFQHPGLRMHFNMVSHFRDAITSAIVADFKRNPEQWTIRGHVVDGLENGSMNFFDNPAGQRLARATKVHDCVYHEIYAEESQPSSTVTSPGTPPGDDAVFERSEIGDRNGANDAVADAPATRRELARQARLPIPSDELRCPYASRSCVCCKRKNAFKVPVPPVRFRQPSDRINQHDKSLLRAKSMRVEYVILATGKVLDEAAQLLATPGWGPILEQAWTCPYVTTMVNECSARLGSKGAHIDANTLTHNGKTVGSPAFLHGADLRHRVDQLCKHHGWVTPKSVVRSAASVAVDVGLIQAIVASKFLTIDTASAQFYAPLADQLELYKNGCPEVPLRLGKNSHVLALHTAKSRAVSAILVIPVDDTTTPCMSLYCETRFERQDAALKEAFRMDPTHKRSDTLKIRVNTHNPHKPTCVCPGVSLGALHDASHHTGVTPIYFVVRHDDGGGYMIDKVCTQCGVRHKPIRTCVITDEAHVTALDNIFRISTATQKRKAAATTQTTTVTAKKKKILKLPPPPG